MHNRIPTQSIKEEMAIYSLGGLVIFLCIAFLLYSIRPKERNLTVSCNECYECYALIGGKVFMTDRVYTADVPGLIENIEDAQESFKFSLHYGEIVYKFDDVQCHCLEGQPSDVYELNKLEARAKAGLQFKTYIEQKEAEHSTYKQHSHNAYNPYQSGKKIAE